MSIAKHRMTPEMQEHLRQAVEQFKRDHPDFDKPKPPLSDEEYTAMLKEQEEEYKILDEASRQLREKLGDISLSQIVSEDRGE